MSTFYIIRTLQTTQTKLIAGKGERAAMEEKAAEMRANGATVDVREFADDARARMSLDPACAFFRVA